MVPTAPQGIPPAGSWTIPGLSLTSSSIQLPSPPRSACTSHRGWRAPTVCLCKAWGVTPWAPSRSSRRSPHPPPGMHWKGGYPPPPPPPGRPACAQPLSPQRHVPASVAFVSDSNRPQPLWQPPPTACLSASGAASEAPSLLMHPCPLPYCESNAPVRATVAGSGRRPRRTHFCASLLRSRCCFPNFWNHALLCPL